MKSERRQFLDAHLHLQDVRFDDTRDAVIQQAVECGIAKMVCNSVSENDWHEVAHLAEIYTSIFSCFGVHPWFVDQVERGWLQRLEHFVVNGCGIGEIGLDARVQSDALTQEEVFCAQLDLAVRYKKPVVIHCVKRWGRMLEILPAFDLAKAAMVFHSFGGSQETLFRLLDMGAYVSFSTRLAEPSRKKMRQAFLQVPMERLFLETDAPDQYTSFLVQENLNCIATEKNKRNEPACVVALYKYAANLRKIDPDIFREQIWKNGQIFTN